MKNKIISTSIYIFFILFIIFINSIKNPIIQSVGFIFFILTIILIIYRKLFLLKKPNENFKQNVKRQSIDFIYLIIFIIIVFSIASVFALNGLS